MRRVAVGVVDGGARAIRNSAISVIRTLARTTPKKTGLARSNWLAKIGSPDLSDRPIRAPIDVVNEARGALNLEVIRRVILSRDEVSIHIANGGEKVPYLGLLNRGSSQKAPAGFVRIALLEGGPKPLAKARLLRGTRGSRAVGV
jgi:hypothetical protein